MTYYQRRMVFITCMALDLISITDAFDCLSCTYANGPDPTIGYDCVNSANSNTVARIPCTAPSMCKAVVELDRDMTTVKSAVRNCFPIGQICQGPTCCNHAGDQPSVWCEQKCREPLCNHINFEAWVGMNLEDNGLEEEGGRIYVPAHLFDVRVQTNADSPSYYLEWTLLCVFSLAIMLMGRRST